jgi:hypothetical protein
MGFRLWVCAGRFTEIALNAGAKVVALDYSSAVGACYADFKQHRNLHAVPGNIYGLPFLKVFFPFVYSLGVLQHTPDVERAFAALPPVVSNGRHVCVDFYWKRIRTMFDAKYLFRPITKKVPQEKLVSMLEVAVPKLLIVSQKSGRVPLVGCLLKRLLPIADYTGIFPLSKRQLQEWALLDTFDMLAPEYDNPQSSKTVRLWLEKAGLVDVEVCHAGHLVGRGLKSL